MSSINLWYFLPFVPFATRGLIFLIFRNYIAERIELSVEYRAAERSFILALAGFSFSALLALAVVDASLPELPLRLEVYYLLISFLCYFSVVNLQKYKDKGWHEQLELTLMDTASLSLLLSVSAIIFAANPDTAYGYIVVILALGVWLIDHVIDEKNWVTHLNQKRKATKTDEEAKKKGMR
jgi:hypothetical protein